jgi:8-oxo-dGTP pyrophosphatase MutT (NUDIX family)
MKHLATITDKNITGADGLSTATPRIAVDTVLFDGEGNIALCHWGKSDFYSIPGGGVDPDEDLTTAAIRETLEETGCRAEITCEIGIVFENLAEIDFTQERYCFMACIIGEKGEPQLTDFEVFLESTISWHPLKKALQLIMDNTPKDHGLKFIQRRNIITLQEVLANHMDKIGGKQ